jgi:multiple sugar transport system ATP-binding protein
MASVTFTAAGKVFPDGTRALSSFDLEVQDGEFMVFVGPSGCGKTSALRMVAGLEELSEGAIRIGDRVVNELEPQERDVAMAFQNYALYPHMSVYENMAFALKLRKTSKSEIDRRVKEAAALLQLEEYLSRKPKALSGGQRQRVAMGRAIVREPQVFLMDEPLSNLDAKLRVQTRTQIASLQRRLGVTTVYVTHDQVEAMTMGDRVAVLQAGLLMQVDTPRRMYDHPNNIFVAGFIGSPAMNLLKTEAVDGGVTLGDTIYPVPRDVLSQAGKGAITIGVRPEDLELSDKGIPVTIELVEELGADANVHGSLRSGETDLPIVARVDGRRPPEKGSTVHFTPKQGHVHLFDTDTGQRIGD